MIQPILCPICHKQAGPETSPFCSPRCRKIDLVRWWDGKYAITEPLSGSAEEYASQPDDEDASGEAGE